MDWRRYLDGLVGGLFSGLGIIIGASIVIFLILGFVKLVELVGAV